MCIRDRYVAVRRQDGLRVAGGGVLRRRASSLGRLRTEIAAAQPLVDGPVAGDARLIVSKCRDRLLSHVVPASVETVVPTEPGLRRLRPAGQIGERHRCVGWGHGTPVKVGSRRQHYIRAILKRETKHHNMMYCRSDKWHVGLFYMCGEVKLFIAYCVTYQWWANPNRDRDVNHDLNTFSDSIWNTKIRFKRSRFGLRFEWKYLRFDSKKI